ncbi:MAG TPA: carbohydrate kinase family protein [Armatimonadaceae bacterium]|nr:carbohydrate kinase family protein [Armatimonadaceae bacterium]
MAVTIACLGLLVADTVGTVIDALPPKGTLALIDRIELHVGGNAANTGIGLARLGVSVAVLGKVGSDGFGDHLVGVLDAHGVETAGVRRDASAATAATIVTVHSDAERSFLHVIGANAAFTAADVDWDILGGARLLYVAGLQLMTAFEGDGVARTLAEAKRRGLVTTLDTVMNPRSAGWAGLEPALPYLDWALPSFEEARALTGEDTPEGQTAKLRASGAKSVAVKLGADGCYVAPAGADAFTVPPFPVRAVDALGAGDAWAAGFLTGLTEGWSPERCARFANAVGACCVQALGATTGIRSRAETLALLGE